MFTMENCFYLLISQAMRYLRDPAVHPRDKQRMKQELSSELVGLGRREEPRGARRGAAGAGPQQVAFSCRAHCSPASRAISAVELPALLLLASCPHHRASPPLPRRAAPRARSHSSSWYRPLSGTCRDRVAATAYYHPPHSRQDSATRLLTLFL